MNFPPTGLSYSCAKRGGERATSGSGRSSLKYRAQCGQSMSVLVHLSAVVVLGLGLLVPTTLRAAQSVVAATPTGSSPALLACEDASGMGECCPHARHVAAHTAPPCEDASLCAAKASRTHLAAGQAGCTGFSRPFRALIFNPRNDSPTRTDQRLQVDRPRLSVLFCSFKT